MNEKQRLQEEIWSIMKTNELCYDPQLHNSPYDAFDGDGGEYHVMHSIKAVKSTDGVIHIYNASKDHYILIDTIDGLKIVRTFIQDPSFSFKENLVCEYNRVITDNKRLMAENSKLSAQYVDISIRLAAHREAFHTAEEQAKKTIALLMRLMEQEKGNKYHKNVYQVIIDTLRGRNETKQESLQGMWEASVFMEQR